MGEIEDLDGPLAPLTLWGLPFTRELMDPGAVCTPGLGIQETSSTPINQLLMISFSFFLGGGMGYEMN